MIPGQTLTIAPVLRDANGNVIPNDPANTPDTTFDWGIVSGSSVSFVGSTTGRSVVIQANSTGSTTIDVLIEQGAVVLNESRFFMREMTVLVNAAPVPGAPEAEPTNPGPVPPTPSGALGVIQPEGSLLVIPGGVQTGTNPQNNALRSGPVVFFQRGSVTEFVGVNVESLDANSLPDLPTGFLRGSSAAGITILDLNGGPLSNYRLRKAAQVCLPVSAADLAAAPFGYLSLVILRFNSATAQWIALTTAYNAITAQACAFTTNFSDFALGLAPGPSAQDGEGGEAGLPATGGWAPNTGMLVLAGLAGFGLIGGGAFNLRRMRRKGARLQ
jgi:hypothetical protein